VCFAQPAPGLSVSAPWVCRHALAHPLVDPQAGQQPQQHHTTMTAAAVAKQRPRQLKPLPQPIAVQLDTKVVQQESIDEVLSNMRGRLQVRAGSASSYLELHALHDEQL